MDKKWIFTFITFVIGFMLAIQFHTTQEPVISDTRDIRELRRELVAEQERRQQLNAEIEKVQTVLAQYEQTIDSREDDISVVLTKQIEELRMEAGLEEKAGEGLVITIDSIYNDQFFGQVRRTPPADVFRYLVNELNIYGADDIAVGDERIISTSAFRDVNQITHLNSRRLPPLPIQVKVLSEKAETLQNQMVVSESVEFFELDGFSISFELVDELELPAYDQTPRVRYMEEVKEG
ncbi:DUF881 domain-containing protein [Halalkalibacter nanhaiisediminis]|uniref:Uncharacterized protein YlxW (UPF0749 family) n=1 Tax=Halalkalibacter nanhaiisediminis TaxID=688079 RepID=A0A562QHV3_9BACI|nr:DUF881 domain-containing protein [Halalkalibacter nanhaiisediminis]TWI55770.1 uncharacterized protein YlxW (UPF0749 family) [Halalkalibacter nanhaiisediminis]